MSEIIGRIPIEQSDTESGLTIHTEEVTQVNVSATNPQALGSQRFGELVRYNAWRYAANLEWMAAIGTSVVMNETPTVARWGAAAAVGIGTYFLENEQTDYAARKINEAHEASGTTPNIYPTLLRDAFSVGASLWQGSGASVEINDAIGLPNTQLRRRIQASAYAAAVSIWASPVLTETGEFAIEQAKDNPVRSAVVLAAGSVAGKFLVIDRIRGIRKRLASKQKV